MTTPKLPNFDDMVAQLRQLSVPGLDPEAILSFHQKNIEALLAANAKAREEFQALSDQQMAMLKQAIETVNEASGDVSKASSPQEVANKQLALAQTAFGTAVNHMLQAAQDAGKANREIMEDLQARYAEALRELSQKTGR